MYNGTCIKYWWKNIKRIIIILSKTVRKNQKNSYDKNKPIRYSEEYEVSGMARTYSYPRFAIGKQRKERFSFDTLRNIFPTMNFNDLVLPGIKSGKSQASFADTIALLFKTSIWSFALPPSTIFTARPTWTFIFLFILIIFERYLSGKVSHTNIMSAKIEEKRKRKLKIESN